MGMGMAWATRSNTGILANLVNPAHYYGAYGVIMVISYIDSTA